MFQNALISDKKYGALSSSSEDVGQVYAVTGTFFFTVIHVF